MNSVFQSIAIANISQESLHISWEFLSKGGPFMIPLALTSVVGVTAIIYKLLALSRRRIIPDELASMLQSHDPASSGSTQALKQRIGQGGSTLARLAAVAWRHQGSPPQEITLAVEAAAREESSRLHAGIGVLDIVITIAPLLGLLGTASGLVTIFDGLSDAADHLAIARGIAVALNTTIFGLAIAVPCVVAHGYFTRRIEVFTARLESLLADFSQTFHGEINNS